jgi:hypothetical protein
LIEFSAAPLWLVAQFPAPLWGATVAPEEHRHG